MSVVSRVHECLARDVSNMNISPKISHGVLECDIVVIKLHGYDFVIKDFVIKRGVLFVPDPIESSMKILDLLILSGGFENRI